MKLARKDESINIALDEDFVAWYDEVSEWADLYLAYREEYGQIIRVQKAKTTYKFTLKLNKQQETTMSLGVNSITEIILKHKKIKKEKEIN